MRYIDELVQHETRRQLLGRGVNAVGWAALASLMGGGARAGRRGPAEARPARAAGVDALRTQGEAGHLPAHGRRAVAARPVRLTSRRWRRWYGQGPPRVDPQRPAPDDDDLGAEAVPGRPVEVQVRPAWPVGDVGQRAAPLHVEDGRRPLLHPEHEHRGDQPRAGHHPDADRQHGHRPPLPGVVGVVWPGVGEPEPADVRGPGRQAVQHRADPGDLGAALVVGLPARRARRRLVPERRRPDPLHQQPAGVPPEVRRRTLDGLAPSTR